MKKSEFRKVSYEASKKCRSLKEFKGEEQKEC